MEYYNKYYPYYRWFRCYRILHDNFQEMLWKIDNQECQQQQDTTTTRPIYPWNGQEQKQPQQKLIKANDEREVDE